MTGNYSDNVTHPCLYLQSKSSLSGPALSNKSSLKKSNTASKADMKAGDDFLEDSDSDFDAPIREEEKQERQHPETTSRSANGLEAPQQSLSPQKSLLADQPWIKESIGLRNPYTDPLNVLQVELLRRSRGDDKGNESDIDNALMITMTGIAAGMRNTG